ncbi:LPS export ABC transporter periplasmic protein LptC [Taylorella equigenitalis]|uniref:LPS export ABC transporter periplasmic protein LptC n=1 Tax=Taylorella equigenitalis TaxID=29575 RepID=UPI00041C2848|nr:LPS export ABC transporter periplasmic protein LptC [Taylorella equigenitalis]ASY37322.1 LPS export ABC transporter periplasmic protein LptC [Taylorella equigenitalis]ASY41745.1 LPS export ABC transporter periplasmic protein LptC [Taylorella equigenitalis]KGK33549.1 hypothetical protein LW90_04215 [Taylorella equigenitalis]RBA27254.1 LPS export ABC transporter periplasmic protein LptC [Taylorella equigenitalis]WDU49602.1 LPS export ABC transporter periplasmic protein LptC [Taylorella equige
MKDKFPTILAFGLLILLVIATWWASEYAKKSIPVDTAVVKKNKPDAWTGNFKMITSDEKGNAINRLKGTRIDHFPQGDFYIIDNPNLIGQNIDTPRTIGTATKAQVLENGDLIILDGNAVVNRPATDKQPNIKIESDKLEIHTKTGIIETKTEVVVHHGESILKGVGMKFDNNTGLLNVMNNSGVEISPDDLNKGLPENKKRFKTELR